jgi:hypothetical protein
LGTVSPPGLNHNFQRKLALFDAAPVALNQAPDVFRGALC